jgi:hypothetical protein
MRPTIRLASKNRLQLSHDSQPQLEAGAMPGGFGKIAGWTCICGQFNSNLIGHCDHCSALKAQAPRQESP